MTKEQLLEKAVYIQYPRTYTTYVDYSVPKNIYKLPFPEKGMLYDGWSCNEHHFTTEYQRKYALPIIFKLLGINYDKGDFYIRKMNSGTFDISMLHPKNDYSFEIFGFNRNEHFDNIRYDDLIDITKGHGYSAYHRLYRYPHECSRIINKNIENNQKIFISGDSQMIPNIAVLACFFKEVWNFDNRDGHNMRNKWQDITFSHVLIEMYAASLDRYINMNFN